MYALSVILTIIGLLVVMSCLGAFPGYPKKSKARKQIIMGVGVGLLFVLLGHQGCQRSYKNVRLAGPEKVAAHFVKSTGEMRYVDPEIRGTEKEQRFKDWKKHMLSGIYAMLGKNRDHRLNASSIDGLNIDSVVKVSREGSHATVEVKGSFEPKGMGYRTTYIFPRHKFSDTLDLIERDRQWYIVDFR